MGYEEALRHIDALGVDAMKSLAPSLHRMRMLCEILDHPERVAPALHVTGTNGKTSTARIASAVLAATGLSVATYTSPHLQTVRERMTLNDEPISADSFGEVFDHMSPYLRLVEEQLDEQLTYFEVLTGMFWLWAAEAPVDAVVVEVGLGGRWDATNVVDAPVSVVTNVGLDHTGLLGTDRETIAREKAGIVKKDAVCVTGERSPGVLAVIEREARAAGAAVSVVGRDFSVVDNVMAVGGRLLSLRTSSRTYENLWLPLHGRHQGLNAACALEAADRFLAAGSLDTDLVAEGFRAASVPGRLELIRKQDARTVVLDVAHNPDGMSALVGALSEEFAFERLAVVLGILADKDYTGMLRELGRVPAVVFAAQPQNVRAVPVEDLVSAAVSLGLACTAAETVAAAVDAASGAVGERGLVCVTGSHYVVGEARDHLLGPLP